MKLLLRAFAATMLIVGAVALSGCPEGTKRALASAAAGAGAGMQAAAPAKLMLFGGPNHRVYLGCLNCSEFASDSVSNGYGTFGSAYSTASIWNHYGEYGSAYSSYGACNAYATDPPVIVDSNGKFYGRLTVNEYHAQIGIGRQYIQWLKTTVCG